MSMVVHRALLLVVVPLALRLPAAANTLFEFSRDTVYEGIQPDSVHLCNLSDDTLVFDTVYMEFDANGNMWVFDNSTMTEIPVVYASFGAGSVAHDIWCMRGGPCLNVLSEQSAGAITASRTKPFSCGGSTCIFLTFTRRSGTCHQHPIRPMRVSYS